MSKNIIGSATHIGHLSQRNSYKFMLFKSQRYVPLACVDRRLKMMHPKNYLIKFYRGALIYILQKIDV
jgi:hypothetical protein